VLHHIPDYLGIVEEFIRVVKPGGIIVIDHEAAPDFWRWDETYINYLDELNRTYNYSQLEIPITYYYYSGRDWQKTPIRRFVRRWKNMVKQYLPSFQKENILDSEEGDIHVYKHDHIKWDKLWSHCAMKCRIVERTDYLVCRERNETAPVWNKWKERCVDMRLLIARKS
jgi:SAM-dependent methyltransferase